MTSRFEFIYIIKHWYVKNLTFKLIIDQKYHKVYSKIEQNIYIDQYNKSKEFYLNNFPKYIHKARDLQASVLKSTFNTLR